MTTTFLKNNDFRIIETNEKTKSIHVAKECSKEKAISILSNKYKKIVELPSAFDNQTSLLVFED